MSPEERWGFGLSQPPETFFRISLTSLVNMCMRRGGGVGARQSIIPDKHRAHFMEITVAAVGMHVCVLACVVVARLVHFFFPPRRS